MKVGILGSGFGAYHASIYKNIPSVESIKVFGRNAEKLQKVKQDLGVEVTDQIDEILNDPAVDLVDVCLPNELHREYVVKALEKGKNVFCETTISTTLEDAEAISQAGKKYGNRVFINLFQLFDPHYSHLHELMTNNTFGGLKKLSLRRNTAPIWGNLGFETIVTNLMIHDIDFITWMLGIPDDIYAAGVEKNDSEAGVTAIFKYGNALAELSGSSMMPGGYPFTTEYEAIFERGAIECHKDFSANGEHARFIQFSPEGKKEITLKQENPYENIIRHVLECCEKGKDTILTADHAKESLNIALAIRDMIR